MVGLQRIGSHGKKGILLSRGGDSEHSDDNSQIGGGEVQEDG